MSIIFRKRPVIFVHGYTGSAASYMKNRAYFLANGYLDDEIYATSMEMVDKKITIRNLFDAMNRKDAMFCRHVKQIRLFIQAVHAYTNSLVDVIGCSMGEAISRKAILGGICVDTGEDIGKPLTEIVHTYVGVVGPNHGALLCLAFPTVTPCNKVSGMACKSKFLNDINASEKYEASKNIFTVYSDTDTVVGYKSYCNLGVLSTSIISGQNRGIKLSDVSHTQAISSEIGYKTQFELIQPSENV